MVRALASLLFLTVFGWCAAQEHEYSQVTRLPSSVNSRGEESMPLLSADGKRLFFARSVFEGNHGGEFAGSDVWISDFANKSWKRATNSISNINNKNHNVVVGLGKDGKSIYFLNISPAKRMHGVFKSRILSDGWTRPEIIPIPGIENLDFIGVYVSPDLDVIFLSMKGSDSRGNEDIYYSVKDSSGEWSMPRNVGASINTPGFEISPFLSADKKRLYFSSNGHRGEGDADIFYSERLYDSWETWSTPVNLGNAINSKKFDAYFSTYGDSVAYFASNRETEFADIYSAKVTVQKTILEKGQRYLTAEEWNKLVSKNVSSTISFPPEITSLSDSQQELIFFIVNKLMLEKEVRFHLVVKEEEKKEATDGRLAALVGHLKKTGIDETRIRIDQVNSPQKSDKGVIEVRLFK